MNYKNKRKEKNNKMKDYIFLFDLDSTLTAEEILPKISITVGKMDEMRRLTEATMLGEIPFKESFTRRVELLSSIPVSEVQDIVSEVKLNRQLIKFLQDNKDCCYIVTGNLDVWIEKLLKNLGLENNCYCSKAKVENDKIQYIENIIDKKEIVSSFKDKIIAVGDGNNDAEMIGMANIGIGFGAIRPIAPAVLNTCTHAIYNENTLVSFLEKFV